MQLQHQVADGMGQIKTHQASLSPTRLGKSRQVKSLAGIVIDASEPDQGYGLALLDHESFDVLGADGGLTRPRL